MAEQKEKAMRKFLGFDNYQDVVRQPGLKEVKEMLRKKKLAEKAEPKMELEEDPTDLIGPCCRIKPC